MRRKLGAVLAAGAFAAGFGLAGCGGEGSKDDRGDLGKTAVEETLQEGATTSATTSDDYPGADR